MDWIAPFLISNLLGLIGVIWQGGKLVAQISHLTETVSRLIVLVDEIEIMHSALDTRVAVLEDRSSRIKRSDRD